MEKESKTYQTMIEEVEKILSELSAQNVDLDSMIKKVESGYNLIGAMKERLNEVKDKVEKLQTTYESKMNLENKDGT
ncbi:MAG: exodeoxyribonuclease VII small subunit [Oligoflexales bacterium]|nr:exodeoxyribonuclease VII small subunit [Oligoflexales bacterium]